MRAFERSFLRNLTLAMLLGAGLSTVPAVRAAEPWTLERALHFALTNNPDMRLAEQRIVAARAGIEQANSALWPQLHVQSSYIRTDNPMMVFGSLLNQQSVPAGVNFNDVPDVDNLNVRGTLTVPLYTGGRISAGRAAARANSGAATAGASAARNTLAFEVARMFYTILKTREFIHAAEAGVNSYENNLVIASNRVAAGTSLKTDVLDMEVRLAQAREDLARARNARALSERALRNILGIESGDFIVADTAPAVPVPAGNDFSGRSELTAVREQQRGAEAQVRGAKSGYLPRLSAFGSLGYDYGWRTDGDGKSYTAGMMIQWDWWDGKLTSGRVKEARANLNAAREGERKLRLAIDLQVEQARLQLNESTERLTVTAAAVAQAQESAELTRSRFSQGLMLATQLIDAETALTGARVRRAEAEADQRIAIAALRTALGLPQLDSVH